MLVASTSAAQPEDDTAPPPRAWTLGPRLGVGFTQTRDEVLAPLSYRGVQFVLGAAFAHARDRNRHQARLEFAPAYKVDRFGYRGIFLTQRLDYAYLRRVVEAARASPGLELGAGLGMELDPVIYADFSTDFPYWQTVYDLRFVARLEHRLDPRRALELDGVLSVLGMASRPPDARFDVGEFRPGDLWTETQSDFGFVSLHNHFYLELRPCFRHSGRGPGSQSVCYGLAVRWLKEPLPIVTLDNRLDYTFWF